MEPPPILWTDDTLETSPAQDLQLAIDEHDAVAYQRYTAKRWYETVVLAPHVALDINDLDHDVARDVLALRYLVGINPPWKG